MSWAATQCHIGKSFSSASSISSRPRAAARRRASVQALPRALVCFSHLRWNFVYQRPQHLMSRFARHWRVMFFEEPLHDDGLDRPWLECRLEEGGVEVLVPHLPRNCRAADAEAAQRHLLDRHLQAEDVRDPLLWYYTPMSLSFSSHLQGSLVVYDCMDELSAFKGAPPLLIEHERQLLARADLVFTGGYSLFEAKRQRHANVHPFPSSVDVAHFARARGALFEPGDQSELPHPRIGFYGVVDERFDAALLDAAASARPQWQFVVLGPVVKIDPAELPRSPNIHWLGPKVYDALPHYLRGWDVAMMPFALNESTRFISPTKTPEYLAGGRPVVSTPIRDVVRQYGDSGVVRIAATPDEFIGAAEAALRQARDRRQLLCAADAALAGMSWDSTCARMGAQIESALGGRARSAQPGLPEPGRSQDSGSFAHATLSRAGEAQASTVSLDAVRRERGAAPARRRSGFDYLIVGAGFAGSVLAERLARELNQRVLIIDRRTHIGGNAYDCYNDDGLLIHRYGPHIFHTNAQRIADYLSRFTRWRPYEHRVLAQVDGLQLPMPINLTTLNRLYGLNLTPQGAAEFLASRAQAIEEIRTSEDVVISQVGRELYEKFFRGYTRKQWGLDPSELDKAVTSRVPTRTNADDRYFTDSFQMMPLHGYTRMFENMLDHPNIRIVLNTDFADIRDEVRYGHLIYCGPIDEFFDYRYGDLPYRSLRFEHRTLDQEWFQDVGVVNYPAQDVPYTRITEYKHLTGQQHPKTALTYEYPTAEGDPYYPIPREENQALYRRYRALADAMPEVSFVGRLGSYRYYNMDQVVGQALTLFQKLAQKAGMRRSEPMTAAQAGSRARAL